MATGVIRSFVVQPLGYFPFTFQPSPQSQENELSPPHHDEERSEEEELQEEEEDDEVFLETTPTALDATSQLLRFADLISQDIQRYFGRSCSDRDACDIYNDTVSLTTSGRLRYYDDLLKIARGGSTEERASCSSKPQDDGQTVSESSDSLGPLAELFDQRGATPRRPMIKRALPLSFWTEPLPGLGPNSEGQQPDPALSPSTNHLVGTPMDFSDLLAFWDAHPEHPQALTDTAHVQH